MSFYLRGNLNKQSMLLNVIKLINRSIIMFTACYVKGKKRLLDDSMANVLQGDSFIWDFACTVVENRIATFLSKRIFPKCSGS